MTSEDDLIKTLHFHNQPTVRSHHGQVKDNISVDKSYQESSSSIPRTIPSVSYGEEVKAGAGHH